MSAPSPLDRPCPYCHGAGYIRLSRATLPPFEVELLEALRDGEPRTAGDLPRPGSTQRMAMRRLEEKGLVGSHVYERHYSKRGHRFSYVITLLGLELLRGGTDATHN